MAGKIKWAGLDAALRDGSNDLSEDPEWQELNAELGSEKVSLARLITKLGYRDKLTISLIKETLDAYRAAHGGENPTARLGAITEGPLAGKITWRALDSALSRGYNGLSEDPEWQRMNKEYKGKFSLYLLCKEFYRVPDITPVVLEPV